MIIVVHRGAAFAWAMLHLAAIAFLGVLAGRFFDGAPSFWSWQMLAAAFFFVAMCGQWSKVTRMKAASLKGWEKDA